MRHCKPGVQIRLRHLLFLLPLLCLFSSRPARAGEGGEAVLRANVREVRIAFAVSDRSGQTVHSLERSDVAVVDDGSIIRRFRSFRPATETALNLVLLLDASGSVESQLAGELAQARSFLQVAAKQRRDRVSILVFGGRHPRLLCVSNCLEEIAPEKLDGLSANGETPLYDALVAAARILRRSRDPEVRPVMILFSDGRDTISIHSLQDALRSAQELAAPIYSVNVCSDKCGTANGDAVLAHLATNTGGIRFGRKHAVREVLRRVLDDLHSGYVLTYEPPQRRYGMHSVRLLPTNDAGLLFRSRHAYLESPDSE